MKKEKSIIGIKFQGEDKIENFGLGDKLDPGRFVDFQALKLFREQCEHLEACDLLSAIYLGDDSIYDATNKCIANFIVANPNKRDDLEKLIIDLNMNKRPLYTDLLNDNEIMCVHSDEFMFPAHSESFIGSFTIKMDNPCLIKFITFSNNLLENVNKEVLNNE